MANSINNNSGRRKKESQVYLWLDSEGWLRFGPFSYLSFDGKGHLVDQDGTKLLKISDSIKVLIPSHKDYSVNGLQITGSEMHPNEKRPKEFFPVG